jgi:hypothetical protein
LAVAVINAGTAVLASSKVTTAVLSANETTTLVTPGTASRLDFTVIEHAEQYMFCTARVMVLSAAGAIDETRRLNPNNIVVRSILAMSVFLQRPSAGFVISTDDLPGPVNEPIAGAGAAGCDGDKVRLIRGELRQVADPGAADAESEQHERHDAARRRSHRPYFAAGRKQALGVTGSAPPSFARRAAGPIFR